MPCPAGERHHYCPVYLLGVDGVGGLLVLEGRAEVTETTLHPGQMVVAGGREEVGRDGGPYHRD